MTELLVIKNREQIEQTLIEYSPELLRKFEKLWAMASEMKGPICDRLEDADIFLGGMARHFNGGTINYWVKPTLSELRRIVFRALGLPEECYGTYERFRTEWVVVKTELLPKYIPILNALLGDEREFSVELVGKYFIICESEKEQEAFRDAVCREIHSTILKIIRNIDVEEYLMERERRVFERWMNMEAAPLRLVRKGLYYESALATAVFKGWLAKARLVVSIGEKGGSEMDNRVETTKAVFTSPKLNACISLIGALTATVALLASGLTNRAEIMEQCDIILAELERIEQEGK